MAARCTLNTCLQQFRRNEQAVTFRSVPALLAVLSTGIVNSFLGTIQDAWYRRRLTDIDDVEPPLFILGHWRSGTTLAHELFSLDDAVSFPNNY